MRTVITARITRYIITPKKDRSDIQVGGDPNSAANKIVFNVLRTKDNFMKCPQYGLVENCLDISCLADHRSVVSSSPTSPNASTQPKTT